ncbi:MAG: hypothetical protein ACTSRH_00125 [Promethearchaeota archaeon]
MILQAEEFHMMDWWIGIFGPFWWIFMILGWAIYISVSILLAYYVHKDAIKRNIVNSEIWLIIVLIFNVLGYLIYILVRNNYNSTNR